LSTAMDVQRFIQVFNGIMLHSIPYLYVPAPLFSPINSALPKTFCPVPEHSSPGIWTR
jgi:hypothetical protein